MSRWMVAALAMVGSIGVAQAQRREPDPAVTYSVPVAGSPARGAKDGHVTLVVGCEFAGPFCHRLRPTLDQLLKEYPRELRVVHKHFVVHPQVATIPAYASCAAHQQGKFWEMADLIWKRGYETYRAQRDPNALGRPAMLALAKQLRLDLRRFERDMDGRCKKIVSADEALLRRVGTGGTPSNYVNGRHLRGAQPIDRFRALIDEELRKARRRTRNRRARARRYYREWVVKRGVKEAPLRQRPAFRPRPPINPRPRRPPRRRPDPKATYAVPVGNSPFRGPKHAKVTMVVACQFSGPFCYRVRATLDQLLNKYNKDLKLVMKHFPVHTARATPAALAACAAHQQGKYWEMDAMLWGPIYTERVWTPERMRQAAREIGLDMSQYDADVSGSCVGEVRAETDEMRKVGVTGTPASYINGRFLGGALPITAFERLIDEELRKANKRIRRRGDVKNYYAKWVIALGVQELKP